MFLYKFELYSYKKDPKITMRMVDAEEKPKTYYIKDGWTSRIKKDDIDRVSGYSGHIVYLLENNFERAKELFVEKIKSDIFSIELSIRSRQDDLAIAERKLEILEQLNGIESEEN